MNSDDNALRLSVTRTQSRNDVTYGAYVSDGGRIWWYAYDDANFRANIYPTGKWRRARDKRGRVWVLEPGEKTAVLEAA